MNHLFFIYAFIIFDILLLVIDLISQLQLFYHIYNNINTLEPRLFVKRNLINLIFINIRVFTSKIGTNTFLLEKCVIFLNHILYNNKQNLSFIFYTFKLN